MSTAYVSAQSKKRNILVLATDSNVKNFLCRDVEMAKHNFMMSVSVKQFIQMLGLKTFHLIILDSTVFKDVSDSDSEKMGINSKNIPTLMIGESDSQQYGLFNVCEFIKPVRKNNNLSQSIDKFLAAKVA